MAAKLFPKVVLFGDSLTQRESDGTKTLWKHFKLPQKPHWRQDNTSKVRKCDVLNRGFSGYTTACNKLILPRILQCDNSPKGSVVAAVVLLGSNDSVVASIDPRGLSVEQYVANLADIMSQFTNDGITASQLVLLTPPAISIDMYTKFCKEQGREMSLSDERLKCFAEKCAELGKSLGVDVVDLYTLFHAQPNWESFLSDGLHLSQEGNRFVADQVIPVLETKLAHLPEQFPSWRDVDYKNPEKTFCSN